MNIDSSHSLEFDKSANLSNIAKIQRHISFEDGPKSGA